jgi:hypothetical protein
MAPQTAQVTSAALVAQRAPTASSSKKFEEEELSTTPKRVMRMPEGVQASLLVSSPKDPAEEEAHSTAKRVMRMPDSGGPRVSLLGRGASSAMLYRQSDGSPNVSPNLSADIQSRTGGGAPLPVGVRSFMEPRFGADFGGVRVHTDGHADRLNRQLGAQAFAVGPNLFFGAGKFRPDSHDGKELIAHELTHTIQQGASPQNIGGMVNRSVEPEVSAVVPIQVQRLFGLDLDPLDFLAKHANDIPGFRLLTIVLGFNPINMSPVDHSAANILRALIEIIPGGALIRQALDNAGVFDKVGAWVEQQITVLGSIGDSIVKAVKAFVSSLKISDIGSPSDVIDRAKQIFTAPVDQIKSFAAGLVDGIIQFIKDAILKPIAKLAQGTPGYDLLKGVLGKDPITDEPVERSAQTLLGPFLKLIGQEEVWDNIQKGNAIPRCWAWLQKNMGQLKGFVQQIPGLFVAAFKALQLSDIINFSQAFDKLRGIFGGFLGKFTDWGLNAIWTLLEIVFDAISPKALAYIKKTGPALKSIFKNPLPFVGNLVRAAKLGFQQFGDHFTTHLKTGLIEWLTGSLPGVYIPTAISLPEIGKFALSVLGISWAQIRGKIVKALGPNGEAIMKGLETGFDVVVALVKGGPAAAWDIIKEKIGDLQTMVIGGITDFVIDIVVKKAIPKLISLFIPGAGFVSAIISIYDTVKTLYERLSNLIAVVTGFIDSMVAIASGAIGAAATKVEGILAGLLSLAINLFASLIGLGNVAEKIMKVIEKVRAFIDKALDTAINFIIGKAKTFIAKLFGNDTSGKPSADSGHDARIVAGLAAIDREDARYAQDGAIEKTDALKVVATVSKEHKVFTSLVVVDAGETWDYEFTASPKQVKKGPKHPKAIKPKGDGKDYQRILSGKLLDLSDFANVVSKRFPSRTLQAGFKDLKGKTNAERARSGKSPVLADGTLVELHHTGQDFFSPLIEISSSFHQSVGDDPDFHPSTGDPGYLSWRGEVALQNGKIRKLGDIYNSIRRNYWKNRGF